MSETVQNIKVSIHLKEMCYAYCYFTRMLLSASLNMSGRDLEGFRFIHRQHQTDFTTVSNLFKAPQKFICRFDVNVTVYISTKQSAILHLSNAILFPGRAEKIKIQT